MTATVAVNATQYPRPALTGAFLCLLLAAQTAGAGEVLTPGFTKSFAPATIGPGSTSLLRFAIDNSDSPTPVADLAFTDTLPAGVVFADPALAATTCGVASVDAPAGGGSLSFSGGSVGAFATCAVTVQVTSSTPGTHTNVSGDLTSSAGNSGPATADLVVDEGLPGFSKVFAPALIPLGAASTLTFTIDNTLGGDIFLLQFSDSLPTNMVVANPSQAASDCASTLGPPTLGATPGSSVISLFASGFAPNFPVLAAGGICTVEVNVTTTSRGSFHNSSGDLLVGQSSTPAGRATDTLEVPLNFLNKVFRGNPAPPGGSPLLEFTIQNPSRDFAATDLAFTDDLDAALSGLTATPPPTPDPPCGPGSTLTGTSLLSLAGGSLPPEGSCTFAIPLTIPAGAAQGTYVNTTSEISGTIDGEGVTGGAASDLLFVVSYPVLGKEFTDDPVGAGGTVTLEFTVTNPDSTSAMSGIEFVDELTTFLPPPVTVTLPPTPDPPCGPGSTLSLVAVGDGQGLFLENGSLAASGACTFAVTVGIPEGFPGGTYTNTTGGTSGVLDDLPGPPTVEGPGASDDLVVVGAPRLTKQFTDDPAQPGGTVTLEFEIVHDETAPGDATSIAFTDDLDAALSGLVAVGLPAADVCGMGSQISGTSQLSFTGGTLAPGASCVFSVTLQLPAGPLLGPYTNTTSATTAAVAGVPTTGNPAVDALRIAGLSLAKAFTDDPALPGGTVTLEFTLDNSSGTQDATGITFSDDLGATLSGLTATLPPTPDPPCGTGSTLTGTSVLTLTGGNLLAGETCTFAVTLQVPGGAADGSYPNTTSNLLATVGGEFVVLDPATDVLTVDAARLALSKEFVGDPVLPGGTVTLRLGVANLDAAQAVTAITFTDDLDAALAGLQAVGLPLNDACGAGSVVSGTSVVTLTGGSLAAGGSCTFDLTLQLPAAPLPGDSFVNTTSAALGDLGGLPVTGDPASDVLRISTLAFAKAFDGPTVPGGQPILTFTVENLDTVSSAQDLSFGDDLSAALAGLTALGLPAADVCGPGSLLEGTTFLSLRFGSVAPASTCSFDVTLQVPPGAAPGAYLNVTSRLFRGATPVADPATATLSVEPPPTFAKDFFPAAIPAGDVSALTFTIDNGASAVAANALAFTDNLPAGVVVASPANASTTCTGGTLTAAPGSSVVAYTGGSVGAGAACDVAVDVTSTAVGLHLNVSGDLTSSSGNSGTASATLEVLDVVPPQVTNVDSVLGTGDGELAECETARTRVDALLVTFDEPMFDPGDPGDPNAVTNPDNWRLFAAGPDRDLSTTTCGPGAGDDVRIVVDEVTYDGAGFTARLELNGAPPLGDAPYRLFACAASALIDTASNPLDGDGDGTGGDDFVRTFRVDRIDALVNGHFDCSLTGWTRSDPGAIVHAAVDVDGAGISGSAAFANVPGNTDLSLGQCVGVFPDSIYQLSGWVRLETPGVQIQAFRACQLFASAGCSGAGLPPQVFFSTLATTGVWEPFVDPPLAVPAGFHSALCQIVLRNTPALPYAAHVDDVSLDGLLVNVIFADGFESGDLSAWSNAVP